MTLQKCWPHGCPMCMLQSRVEDAVIDAMSLLSSRVTPCAPHHTSAIRKPGHPISHPSKVLGGALMAPFLKGGAWVWGPKSNLTTEPSPPFALWRWLDLQGGPRPPHRGFLGPPTWSTPSAEAGA